MNKQTLIVMCGLPGSGKSKWADTYSKSHPEYTVISTDAIRKELFGSEDDQSNGWTVFLTAYERILKAIEAGGNAIFDATNVRRRDRRKIIKFFSKYDFLSLKLVLMDTPVQVCKLRDADSQRGHHVGEETIDRMNNFFTKPDSSEGWDEIIVVRYEEE